MTHIRQYHYESHVTINPSGVVPVGSEFDLDAPHRRATLG